MHITIWKTLIFPVACKAVVNGGDITFINAVIKANNKNWDVYLGIVTNHNCNK